MTLKTSKFDAADYLDSPEAIAAYLNDVMDSGDTAELIAALGTVARAKGMSQVARDAGLGRESLYKALGGSAKPEFATVSKVMASLGLKVTVLPVKPLRRRSATKRPTRVAAKK